MNIILFLAQNFGSAQGVCLSLYPRRTVVLRGLGTRQKQRGDHPKEPLKYKTKPKQTQFKAKQSQFFGGHALF